MTTLTVFFCVSLLGAKRSGRLCSQSTTNATYSPIYDFLPILGQSIGFVLLDVADGVVVDSVDVFAVASPSAVAARSVSAGCKLGPCS